MKISYISSPDVVHVYTKIKKEEKENGCEKIEYKELYNGFLFNAPPRILNKEYRMITARQKGVLDIEV